MNLVKVVIPVYTVNLSALQLKVLMHNLEILNDYSIVFVCPESLDISTLKINDKIEIERFENKYFEGIAGYNKLMLSTEFYSRFLDTEYILICQTDAFVFRDELKFWCNKNYDYIGAPWIGSSNSFYNNSLRKISNIIRRLKGKSARNWDHLFKVGNGGFSLRKVKSHYTVTNTYEKLIAEYLSDVSTIYHIEDVFWSLKAPVLSSSFLIPEYVEALSFAIDRKPKKAMKLNGNILPFACHGYDKKKVFDFWQPIINKFLNT